MTVPLDYTMYARDEDVAFFQRELASFVPDRVSASAQSGGSGAVGGIGESVFRLQCQL